MPQSFTVNQLICLTRLRAEMSVDILLGLVLDGTLRLHGYRIYSSYIRLYFDINGTSSYFRKPQTLQAILLRGDDISLNLTISYVKISENYCTCRLHEMNSIINTNL